MPVSGEEIEHLVHTGLPIDLGEQLMRGHINELLKTRNGVALLCLHGLLCGFSGNDVPKVVERAFHVADTFMKKMAEPSAAPEAEEAGT